MVLEFVKCFFYWDNCLLFYFYHWLIHWFSYLKPNLHSWDKSYLVIVCNQFFTLLGFFFARTFASIWVYSFLCFFWSFVWFWYQGNTGRRISGKCLEHWFYVVIFFIASLAEFCNEVKLLVYKYFWIFFLCIYK